MNNFEKMQEAQRLINEVIADEYVRNSDVELNSVIERSLGDQTPKMIIRLDIITSPTKCIG